MSESPDVMARASKVRLLALDVDGVLTDGRLYYGESGEALKAFHSRDGLGLRLLLDEGLEVVVITARRSSIVVKRCEELRIRRVFVGRDDKRSVLAELSTTLGIEPAAMAFVGDDVLDLPALRFVGLPIAVADAHPRVRAESALVTSLPGGKGAVREVADLLLASRGRLDAAIEHLFASHLGKGEHDKV